MNQIQSMVGSSALMEPRPKGASFSDWRNLFDALVLGLYSDAGLKRTVKGQLKTNLGSIWIETARKLEQRAASPAVELLQIHRILVKGLPGEALFVSSAMVFDSIAEALPLFDLSVKTAKQRIGDKLSASESEIALRIGRVLTMARSVLGSSEAARNYLRTPNFSLGGVVPRELLKTAEGEQLVLGELQTQAEGGPV